MEKHDSGLEAPLRPYDLIRDIPVNVSKQCAEEALAGRPYVLKEMEFSLSAPIDWLAIGQSRSYKMYVYSWNFLEPLFVSYSDTGSEECFALLQRHIDSWIDCFSDPAHIERDIKTAAEKLDDEGSFIGHAMAIAGRFYRLSYFIDASLRNETVSDKKRKSHISSLRWHALFLSQNRLFPANHNHGIQVALAQIAGASRFLKLNASPGLQNEKLDLEESYCQGRRRLLRALSAHVTADGIHKEHSPHYHMVVLHAVHEALRIGLLTDPKIQEIVALMKQAASWMFDINGYLANFGDSDQELFPAGIENFKGEFSASSPQEHLFEQGGYWFVKGRVSTGPIYLAHMAAFHSRTHKHADTGTFIWQDRGRQILVDTGRFGYAGRTKVGSVLFNDGFWYDDPHRVYAEETRAHNTFGISGSNHPRFRTTPFGSSITASVEQDGVFACESSIPCLPGVKHFRILICKPGQWLMCVDSARSANDKNHDVRQYFHIHPDWSLKERKQQYFKFKTDDNDSLYVTSIFDDAKDVDFAYGRESSDQDSAADFFGWWSPRHLYMEPCNSVAIGGHGKHITMASFFSFTKPKIDKTYSSFNVTRRRLRFRWNLGGDVETIIINRDNNAPSKLMLTVV